MSLPIIPDRAVRRFARISHPPASTWHTCPASLYFAHPQRCDLPRRCEMAPTPRERVLTALAHRQPDVTPLAD